MATRTQTQALFGLDIGNGSLKVMQLLAAKPSKQAVSPQIIGYGHADFTRNALAQTGEIIDYDAVAKAAYDLFVNRLNGHITSRQVVMAIPTYHSATRLLRLPINKPKQLNLVIRSAFERQSSLPVDTYYLQRRVLSRTKTSVTVLVSATPKAIIDSYRKLAAVLGIDIVRMESSMDAAGRLFQLDKHSDVPAILIDFGYFSADISVFDHDILSASSVRAGGQLFTSAIQNRLGVTAAEAGLIKTRYGLGVSKKQTEILQAINPILTVLVNEVRRQLSLHSKRFGNERPIQQIISLGGGANMPGLSGYLTDTLRLAVRYGDPWHYCSSPSLTPPAEIDKPMYATAAGLALTGIR